MERRKKNCTVTRRNRCGIISSCFLTISVHFFAICIPYARHYKPRLVYFFTPFPKSIYVLWPLALCMACIQERLLIKSGLWLRAYGNWIKYGAVSYSLSCIYFNIFLSKKHRIYALEVCFVLAHFLHYNFAWK